MEYLVAPLNRLVQFIPLRFRSTLCLGAFIKARPTSLGLSANQLLSCFGPAGTEVSCLHTGERLATGT